MKLILLFASIYNVASGLIVIFIPETASRIVQFNWSCDLILRLFIGGTAVVFGTGYFNLFINPNHHITLLYYGAAIKYWVFIICSCTFIFSRLSVQMLCLVGLPNLIFAVFFTMYIIGFPQKTHPEKPSVFML